jgi:hypothetical protein
MRRLVQFGPLLLFLANILNGILPEYGPSGGWEYSVDDAIRDCREFGRHVQVYSIDEAGKVHFSCNKK